MADAVAERRYIKRMIQEQLGCLTVFERKQLIEQLEESLKKESTRGNERTES